MERNQFLHFADILRQRGAAGVGAAEFALGRSNRHQLQYIPFEHVNRQAKLVIVGITPGNTQLRLAYQRAQELLLEGRPVSEILVEVKKAGAFGGPSMKPNLLKMLHHFHFERILGVGNLESLWGANAHLLHSTSVVPHAAFEGEKMFAGSFKEVMDSPLLAECFMDCFVPSAREMAEDAVFVGLGPCPQAALEWCVDNSVLHRRQVLGSFCHPSSSGGSTTGYYLREIAREKLSPKDPVRWRCDWLDQAYVQMKTATDALLGKVSSAPKGPMPLTAPVPVAASSTKDGSAAKNEKSGTKVRSTEDRTSEDVIQLISAVRNSGYSLEHQNVKVAEFKSPAGQVIYLDKSSSRLNSIKLTVHPALNPEMLRKLEGVDAVSTEHKFHSNMTKFPKRLNNGKTETSYGWQVLLYTSANLPRFLADFKDIGL